MTLGNMTKSLKRGACLVDLETSLLFIHGYAAARLPLHTQPGSCSLLYINSKKEFRKRNPKVIQRRRQANPPDRSPATMDDTREGLAGSNSPLNAVGAISSTGNACFDVKPDHHDGSSTDDDEALDDAFLQESVRHKIEVLAGMVGIHQGCGQAQAADVLAEVVRVLKELEKLAIQP